ncbi:C40 family peptidase [Corynebacterium qintianiae]|uniref:C40 family peptidase n=1 Tax=Corynebacterium qintianiae TaxID=2709392 RepID=UPI002017FEC9|nr:C40 family peptidase [Corynebacterium qintianiae]
MISPSEVLAAVAARIPHALETVPVPSLPSLAAVAELARVVDADPSRVTTAAEALSANRGVIDQTAGAAAVLIPKAGTDIATLGQRYLAEAATLLPLALAPGTALHAAVRLTELAYRTYAQVQARLEQLEADLRPHTRRLLDVVASIDAEPKLQASPSAQRATDELRMLAASDAREVNLPPEPAADETPKGSAAGRAAVEAAKSQIGAPYKWGGTGPGGFDCSGLTSWAYRQAGVELPRMAHQQATGTQVSYDQLQPGDLAVWDGHVAMYAGDGMYIEAGDPVQMNPVRTENIGMPFKGFWRPAA